MAQSFWHATRPVRWREDELPASADVAVIGAGLHGACTAYALAQRGLRPVLIERGLPGDGASGRNGGLGVAGPADGYAALRTRVGPDLARTLMGHTVAGLTALQDQLLDEGIDADLRAHGHVVLALTEEEAASLAGEAEARQSDGFRADWIGPEGLAEVLGVPPSPEVHGGVVIHPGLQMHSGKLVAGVAGTAQRLGARVCSRIAVTALSPDAGAVQVHTEQGVLTAGSLVVCANAWAAALLPALQSCLTPVRGQMLATSPLPPLVRTGFSAHLTTTEEYGQQLPSGELIFGGCRALAPDHDRGITALGVTAEVQAGLEQALTRLFPRLPDFTVTHRWAGTMAWTSDHQPILDRLPDAPVFFSAGFSGHGLPFAGTFAHWLADAVIRGQLPAEAQPYRVARA